VAYLIHVFCLFIVHSSPFLCVCDDRMIRYPRADDLIGGPGDAQTRSEGYLGIFVYMLFILILR